MPADPKNRWFWGPFCLCKIDALSGCEIPPPPKKGELKRICMPIRIEGGWVRFSDSSVVKHS